MTEIYRSEEFAENWLISQERYQRMVEVARRRQIDLSIVVENVHDPHNVSAIVRSADAVGIATAHLLYTREQFPRLNQAVSKGSHRWLRFRYWTSPEPLFAFLRAQGYRTYATALHEHARPLYSLDLTRPSVIIVGNEHRGVSEETQALADERIFIPMVGMAQSLNVSVATAVILYEALRQRRATGAYDRSELTFEQQELLEGWLNRELERRTRKSQPGRRPRRI